MEEVDEDEEEDEESDDAEEEDEDEDKVKAEEADDGVDSGAAGENALPPVTKKDEDE